MRKKIKIFNMSNISRWMKYFLLRFNINKLLMLHYTILIIFFMATIDEMPTSILFHNIQYFPGFHDIAILVWVVSAPSWICNKSVFCRDNFWNCHDNFLIATTISWLPRQFLNCPTFFYLENLLRLEKSAATIFLYKKY